METIFRIDDAYSFLTKELLMKEYIDNKLTDRQIAKKYNISSKVTVWRRRKFLGIQNNTPSKSNKNASKNRVFNISKDEVLQHLLDGLTYVEIAEKMGCSRMVAYRRMKELGVIDNQTQAMQKLKWHEPLTEHQIKFVLGCLLGDGNMTSKGMFQCSHSYKQLNYIEYKKGILKNIVSPNFSMIKRPIKNHQNGKTYFSYFFRTMNNEFFKNIYDAYYINKIKVFPYDYLMNSSFDAYSLAIWYMDDGGRKGNISSIYSFSFGYEGNLDILRFLKNKFNIEGSLKIAVDIRRADDKRHFISFNKNEAQKFFKIVSPHIIPYFEYKIPKTFRPP